MEPTHTPHSTHPQSNHSHHSRRQYRQYVPCTGRTMESKMAHSHSHPALSYLGHLHARVTLTSRLAHQTQELTKVNCAAPILQRVRKAQQVWERRSKCERIRCEQVIRPEGNMPVAVAASKLCG